MRVGPRPSEPRLPIEQLQVSPCRALRGCGTTRRRGQKLAGLERPIGQPDLVDQPAKPAATGAEVRVVVRADQHRVIVVGDQARERRAAELNHIQIKPHGGAVPRPGDVMPHSGFALPTTAHSP